MTLIDSVVATLAAGIKTTQNATVSQVVADAYAQVKQWLRDQYPALDLQALERRPDSPSKQQSVAEDLTDLGAISDSSFLTLIGALAQVLVENLPATAIVGVDLAKINAAALKISDVRSSGPGVRVRDASTKEEVEVTNVQAGAQESKPFGHSALDIEFNEVKAGRDIIINQAIDPHLAHIATLRLDYLQHLLQRVDTIFLSHINPNSQVAPRISLKAVYTAQLTQSLITAVDTGGSTPPNEQTRDPGHRLSAVESLNLHQHLVLLGAPGSGKSSFLKFVALCMAGAMLGHEEANLTLLTAAMSNANSLPTTGDAKTAQAPSWDHGPLLPVYIPLRDLIAEGVLAPQEQGSIEQLMEYLNRDLARMELDEYAPYLRRELREEGGLLLLDGLDEVPEHENQRLQIRQAIEEFSALYPKCRVVLSSRPYAYQDPTWQLPHFSEATLAPFDQWQIDCFIDHYYTHLLRAQGIAAVPELQAGAEAVKAAIKNTPSLRELATTPLLLTLMVSLFVWRGGVLLDKREELYAQGVDLLLNEWERPKGELADSGNPQSLALSVHEWLQSPRQNIRHALEELAFRAHAQQANLEVAAHVAEDDLVDALLRAAGRDARPRRLAEYIQNRAGLLIDHGNGWHSFPHRIIQEYLAACYLTRTNFPKQLATLVQADPQRWREVLMLAGEKAVRGAPFAVWALIDRLCPLPYDPTVETTETQWWMALLAGRLLVETELYQAEALDLSEAQTLTNVKQWLLALLATPYLPSVERAIASADLDVLGDTRRGVGLTGVGLPDIDWIQIGAGPFLMGAAPFACPLITAPYRIARYPITVAQYQAFVRGGGYEESRYWTETGWMWRQAVARRAPTHHPFARQSRNQPQTGVCWYEAMAFCNWLTAQTGERIDLPSEAQWERAARHIDGRVYPWGDDSGVTQDRLPNMAVAQRCNMRESGVDQPTPVGIFPRGNAACGAADLAGNVWEWCATKWRNTYNNYVQLVDDTNTGTERRVLRGGSWANEQHFVRCAHRHRNHPDHWGPNVGFRVVALPP